jgi:hypothetical protein
LSGGFSIIIAEQSAQPLATANCALVWEWIEFGSDDLVSQPLVIPFGVVM